MTSTGRLHFITLCGLLSGVSEYPLCKQEVKQAFSSGWGLGGSCLSPNHRFLRDMLGHACSSSQAGKRYPAFTQHLSACSKADPFPWGAPALWSIHQWHFAWAGAARIRPHDTNMREQLSSDLGKWSGHATGWNASLGWERVSCVLLGRIEMLSSCQSDERDWLSLLLGLTMWKTETKWCAGTLWNRRMKLTCV